MRRVATFLLFAFFGTMVCAADASMRSANPCCDPCSMASSGEASCDCCQVASAEEPFVTVAKQTCSPSLSVVALPATQQVVTTEVLNLEPLPRSELDQPVRDNSPPKLYVLNVTLLI